MPSYLSKAQDFFSLLWLNLVVKKRNLVEFVKTACRYYGNWPFFKLDASLLLTYLFDNPFQVSQRFLKDKGEMNIYAYGETPLTTLELIATNARFNASDTLFELGCGRGRTCFWLNQFIGCKVVGIDFVPAFIERAERVRKKLRVSGIEFRCEDMRKSDFTGATGFYFYGTCYDEPFIRELIEKFKRCPSGTKIVSISYPLSDYTNEPLFEVMSRFPALFTWGKADVYVQIRR